jgi:hypothetical protein
MNMTTGITTFNSSNRKVAKIKPLPADVYTLVIPAQKWSVELGKKASSTAYVKGFFEAEFNGSKRRIYVNFFNSLTPSKKDAIAMTDRPNGVTALTAAVGVPLVAEEADILSKSFVDEESGNEEVVQYLNPKVVIAYLESLSGTQVRAKVGIEGSENDQYGEKNVIKSFLPPVAS